MHTCTLLIYAGSQTTFYVCPLGLVPLRHENELCNSARSVHTLDRHGMNSIWAHLGLRWPKPPDYPKRSGLAQLVNALSTLDILSNTFLCSLSLKRSLSMTGNGRKITGHPVLALHDHNLELEKPEFAVCTIFPNSVHAIVLESLQFP